MAREETVMSEPGPRTAIEQADHADVTITASGLGWYYTVAVGPMEIASGFAPTRGYAEWKASSATRRWFHEQPQPDSMYTLNKFGKRRVTPTVYAIPPDPRYRD
jgi:hypothetical protein